MSSKGDCVEVTLSGTELLEGDENWPFNLVIWGGRPSQTPTPLLDFLHSFSKRSLCALFQGTQQRRNERKLSAPTVPTSSRGRPIA